MTTKRWLGSAYSVNDLWTVSLSGTVISQTYTMMINSKSVTYTAGGSDTVTIILSALAAAWNASTIVEFTEATATALPAGGPYTSMTITGDTAGNPLTISMSTGGGATFSIAHTTSATGPNDFTNGQNWSGGSAPANSDTLVFDNGSANCSFNINSSLTGITMLVNPGYSGKIGLPQINVNGQTSYNEYRTTNLTLAGGTVTINCPTLQQCNLAFGSNTSTVRVLSTGARLNTYIPVVLITGGNGSSELDVSKGDVGIAFYQGQTANFPTIKTGYIASVQTDAVVTCGAGSTLGTIVKNGGVMTVSANSTTITQDIGGGTLTLTDSVTVTTLNVYAGTVAMNTSGTVGTVNLYGSATLTLDGDPRGKTITNPINVYSPSVSVTDTAKTVNSGIMSLAMNGVPSCNFFHGGNSSIVIT